MHKIIVTGPESSGKTTLCKALSKHFNLPFSKEYAREYLDTLNRDYNQEDLLKIAKGQLKSEQNTQLLDTDLITIKIWSKYKYGSCDKWILEQIEKQKSENRFYLLCKPDIPWKADPLRENPNDREELFEIYKKELESLAQNYFIVEGENIAEQAIYQILQL
jgi:nicotinamide riboside kinase